MTKAVNLATVGSNANSGGTLITSGTAVNAATGSPTSIDFTSIPSWVKRITVMFNGVSLSGTALYLVQLGDSGGIETTGYNSGAGTNGGTNSTNTTGFLLTPVVAAADLTYGQVIITNINANNWVYSSVTAQIGTSRVLMSAGSKTLSDTLDRIRITTTSTDTFDAGTINILYE